MRIHCVKKNAHKIKFTRKGSCANFIKPPPPPKKINPHISLTFCTEMFTKVAEYNLGRNLCFTQRQPVRLTWIQFSYYHQTLSLRVGRDSSVGIATGYRLGGPGIEPGGGRDFPYPSRPALGPIKLPAQ